MAEGARPRANRRAAPSRPAKGKQKQSNGNGDGGRTIPLTSEPSINNVLGGFYNSLPPMVRELLPLGSIGGGGNGRDAHALTESFDTTDAWKGAQYALLLTIALAQ